MPHVARPLLDRLFDRIEYDTNGGCWLWSGATTCGYGQIGTGEHGRSVYTHRVMYEAFVGPIPPDREIDHLCRVPCCVNPAHLEAVTSRENTLRGQGPAAKKASQTTCQYGHQFSVNSRGRRVCRECRREDNRRRYAQRRGVLA